jgi:hypothetical protein
MKVKESIERCVVEKDGEVVFAGERWECEEWIIENSSAHYCRRYKDWYDRSSGHTYRINSGEVYEVFSVGEVSERFSGSVSSRLGESLDEEILKEAGKIKRKFKQSLNEYGHRRDPSEVWSVFKHVSKDHPKRQYYGDRQLMLIHDDDYYDVKRDLQATGEWDQWRFSHKTWHGTVDPGNIVYGDPNRTGER